MIERSSQVTYSNQNAGLLAQVSEPGPIEVAFSQQSLIAATHRIRETACIVKDPETGGMGVLFGGKLEDLFKSGFPILAVLPPLYPEWLGDRSFLEVHNVRFPYVAGAMANGIATTDLVIEMARCGALGFFGSAGLSPERVIQALDTLERELGIDGPSWGANLIHSPNEPALEAKVADLYIKRDVRRVSAAAYMNLTPSIVRYAYTGLQQDAQGNIHRKNHVFAKISRPEVARHFMSPAPQAMLTSLVAKGLLTETEAQLARFLPVAEDFTVESDSGGHTDNQPLGALFPTILSVRDELMAKHQFARPIRVGAAGGIGTPNSVASAFSLGAAYVLTGSVNQACIESGLDATGKQMLAQAGLADVIMAPAADMFEMGVEVQVLKRGTMFGVKAKKLYDIYKSCPSLEAIPANEKARLEKDFFKAPLEEAWQSTANYWQQRDPQECIKADKNPKHKMALLFRAYLGQSSRWAIAGDPTRRLDYQIWCGPAMGSFNQWTKGTFLEAPENRQARQVALNLLEGGAVVTRAQQFRSYGVPVPSAAFDYRPRPFA